MSHFTKVRTQINDMTALQNALSALGLNLKHNCPCRYYYGSKVKQHVCPLPGRYDVAFSEQSDGTFAIDADFYAGDVERSIGKGGITLLRSYAVEKLKLEAAKKHFTVRDLGNNKLRISDPTDSSGGYLEAQLESDGSFTFKAKGFQGKSCMKFSNLESAFGDVILQKKNDEYYTSERQTEKAWY